MYRVELGDDDFDGNSDAVKVAKVSHAVTKLLLANGSTNKFQAERDAWSFILTGITAGKLHPFNPATLGKLSPDNCTDGVVRFDELVEWGRCKYIEFVKQAASIAKSPHPLWVERLPECDANGKLECKPDTEIDYYARNAPEATSKSGDAAAKGEAGAGTSPSGDDWKTKARAIADECFDHDTNATPTVRDSLATKNASNHITGGYCFRVMAIMQERGIKGPRGLITNPATIMRDALQGDLWWAKKQK